MKSDDQVMKMKGKNYYTILGVGKSSSEQDIKQAYRRLARKYHPDVNPGDMSAETKFKQINEAYEVLSNKEKRSKYDQFGDQWQYADRFQQTEQQRSPFGEFRRAGSTGFTYEEADLGNLFGDLFGSRFGGQKARPSRGRDIEHKIEVNMEEAYLGTKRTVALKLEEPCTGCNNSGHIRGIPCSACRGSGVVSRIKRLEVKIPAGVKSGSKVRIAGKGEPGIRGTYGDLYLMISVKPHKLFERYGNNLHTEVKVPLVIAMLGGEAEVPILTGKLALKIPPETQNGRIFRLKGKGMPHVRSALRGDLLVKVNVVLPTDLSSQEKELFSKLGKLR